MLDVGATMLKKAKRTANGCMETHLAGAGNGYAQVRMTPSVKMYAHRLAAWMGTRIIPENGEEASHLCHNYKCVNPAHLTFEDQRVNKQRWCCEAHWHVTDGYWCPHRPQCL
jgi:hypothetical protein